jgi:hypothetical protein
MHLRTGVMRRILRPSRLASLCEILNFRARLTVNQRLRTICRMTSLVTLARVIQSGDIVDGLRETVGSLFRRALCSAPPLLIPVTILVGAVQPAPGTRCKFFVGHAVMAMIDVFVKYAGGWKRGGQIFCDEFRQPGVWLVAYADIEIGEQALVGGLGGQGRIAVCDTLVIDLMDDEAAPIEH